MARKGAESDDARHVPGLLAGERPSKSVGKGKVQAIFDGLKMPPKEERALKHDAQQKEVQAIIGELKFPEPVNPMISLPLHKLSCIMAYPPPDALFAAQLVAEMAYDARFNGITYGGANVERGSRVQADFHAHLDLDGAAPKEMEAMINRAQSGDMPAGVVGYNVYVVDSEKLTFIPVKELVHHQRHQTENHR